jgi:two-component system NarL family sensor kinase
MLISNQLYINLIVAVLLEFPNVPFFKIETPNISFLAFNTYININEYAQTNSYTANIETRTKHKTKNDTIKNINLLLKYNNDFNYSIELITQISKNQYDSGFINLRLNKHLEAIGNWQNAFWGFSKLDLKRLQGASLFNISNVFFELQDYDKYLEYTNKAISYFKLINDTINIAACYINLGNYAHIQDRLNEAVYFYNEALLIFQNSQDKANILTCLGNIGGMYHEMGDLEKSNKYSKSADSLALELNNVEYLSRAYYNESNLKYDKAKYTEAIALLIKSIEMSKKIENFNYLSKAYKKLAECEFKLGNFENAYLNMIQYTDYKDSLLSFDKIKQLTLAETKFRNELNENKIKLLELERIRSEQNVTNEKSRARMFLIILILITLLSIITLWGVLTWFKNKSRQALSKQKSNLQREYISAVLKSQESERSNIARDLHDNLGQKLSALIFKTQHLIEHKKDNIQGSSLAKDVLALANNCYKDIRSISHQMMPKALEESIITDAIEDLLNVTFGHTNIKFTINNNLQEQPDAHISRVLYRICQELLNNIIKHSKAKEVHVSLIENNDNYVLMMEDDGVGIASNFGEIKKDGIGMQNIMARIELVDGSFTIENIEPQGLISIIRIPKK